MNGFDFSMEDIEALLESIDTKGKIDSFLYVKPSDFQNIQDEELRRRLKERYQIAQKYYLAPLERLLNTIGKQIGKYLIPYRPESDLSINEQIVRASIELNKQGFTSEQLLSFVPKDVDELKALLPEGKTVAESRGR